MKVVALISGGKDSCYNMMQCVQHGHEIVALANLKPPVKDEMDSYMYQTVGHQAIDMYAEAMGLPLYRRTIQGSSLETGRNYVKNDQDEVEDLYQLLLSIQSEVQFEAVSVGAILSDYQRVRVEHVCSRLGLTALAYLWRRDQKELFEEMIANGLVAVIIKVAVMGLVPHKHLGLSMKELHPVLIELNSQFGLNICGEGGEYETFTLDCPLFKKSIVIDKSKIVIHADDAFAQVGFLQLTSLHLEDKQEPKNNQSNIPVPYMGDPVENIPENIKTEDNKQSTEMKEVTICLPKNNKCCIDAKESISCNSTDGYIWITGLKGYTQEGLSIQEITKNVMDKLIDKVEELNSSLSDAVLIQLFVKNINDFAQINAVYKEYFSINPPARACVQGDLEEGCIILLDCLIYKCTADDMVDNMQEKSACTREAMHVQSISHWASTNIGPYSQVIKVGPMMFLSGSVGFWPATMLIINGGVAVEAALALRHVDRIITAISSSTQSLLNGFYGICYVTQHQDIPVAEEALTKALKAKITDDIYNKPLITYVVVPSLPKNALIEWQLISYQYPEQMKGLSRSIKNDDISLEFDGLYHQDDMNLFCAAITCDIFSDDAGKVPIDRVITIYIKELKNLCVSHDIEKHLLTLRICYLKQAFNSSQEKQLYSAVRNILEESLVSIPGFALLPVNGLKGKTVIHIRCLLQP